MRIHKTGWICTNNKKEPRLPEMGRLKCGRCGESLQHWYEDLFHKLEPLLPKNYLPICCYCAFRCAMNLTECPVCGAFTTADWSPDNDPCPRIKCKQCGWKKKFLKLEEVEEKISDYLVTLW